MLKKDVLSQGRSKKQIVILKSEVFCQGTATFCRRFLKPANATVAEKMEQSAAECRRNLDASEAAEIDRETELRLIVAARMALEALGRDYFDYLKDNGSAEWETQSREKIYARKFAREHNDWESWREFCESRPAETVANLMIVILMQARVMLERIIVHLQNGSRIFCAVRERQNDARTREHDGGCERVIRDCLGAVATDGELAERAGEIKRMVDQAVDEIRKQRGWIARWRGFVRKLVGE